MKVQTPLSRVLIIPHTLSKFFLICSPCLSKKPLTVSIHIPAAVLSKSHTFSRNSLTLVNALNIACRALSAPIPALSNIVPISESFPMRKLIKSSTINASNTTKAIIPSVLRLVIVNSPFSFDSSVIKADAPFEIFSQFITTKKAPATIVRSFNALSTPPSLFTTVFIIPAPLLAPTCKVCIIRSMAGFNRFTSEWRLLNAFVTIPISDVSFCIPAVAFIVRLLSSFNTITAGFRNPLPAAAFKSCRFCFKLPS